MLGSARRRTAPPLGRGGGGRIHPSSLVCPHPARCRVQAPLSSASLRRRCAPRPRGVGLRSSCPRLSAPHSGSRMPGMSPGTAVPHPPTHSCTGCALSVLVCHADPEAWQPRPLLRASRHRALLRRGEKRRSATARRSCRKVRLLGDTVLWASPRPRWEHRARVEVAGVRPRRALRSSLARALHFLGLLRRCRLHLHALCSSAFALLSRLCVCMHVFLHRKSESSCYMKATCASEYRGRSDHSIHVFGCREVPQHRPALPLQCPAAAFYSRQTCANQLLKHRSIWLMGILHTGHRQLQFETFTRSAFIRRKLVKSKHWTCSQSRPCANHRQEQMRKQKVSTQGSPKGAHCGSFIFGILVPLPTLAEPASPLMHNDE